MYPPMENPDPRYRLPPPPPPPPPPPASSSSNDPHLTYVWGIPLDSTNNASLASQTRFVLRVSLLMSLLALITGILNITLGTSAGSSLLISILIPSCGYFGVKQRSQSCLKMFYICNLICSIVFIFSAISVVLTVFPAIKCKCDPTCTDSRYVDMSGGNNSTQLSPQWQSICDNEEAVVNAYDVSLIIGAIMALLQCIGACAGKNLLDNSAFSSSTIMVSSTTSPLSGGVGVGEFLPGAGGGGGGMSYMQVYVQPQNGVILQPPPPQAAAAATYYHPAYYGGGAAGEYPPHSTAQQRTPSGGGGGNFPPIYPAVYGQQQPQQQQQAYPYAYYQQPIASTAQRQSYPYPGVGGGYGDGGAYGYGNKLTTMAAARGASSSAGNAQPLPVAITTTTTSSFSSSSSSSGVAPLPPYSSGYTMVTGYPPIRTAGAAAGTNKGKEGVEEGDPGKAYEEMEVPTKKR